MLKMILPIALLVLSNTFYNITQKKTPADANAFLSLAVTYAVAAAACLIIFFVGYRTPSVSEEFKKLNWTSFVLGIVIIGLEFGYILAYRAGWDVSKAPLVSNCCLAVVLVFVGIFVFREKVTPKQMIGMAVCISGLVIVTV